MMDVKKIAVEIFEDATPDVVTEKAEPANIGKPVEEEDSSGVVKGVHANSWHCCLTIKKMVSPPTIDEAVKVAKDLEELLTIDSEKIPYALEHSHLKIGEVVVDKSYHLTSCDCTLYVCAHITITNGGDPEGDEIWGKAANEIAKKFGYKD